MPTIRVTATATFDYDTHEGLVSSEEEARADVVSTLDRGLSSGQFVLTTVVTPDPLIEERSDGTYYTGPLGPAMHLLYEEYGNYLHEFPVNERGTVRVVEFRGGTRDNPNQWGNGATSEAAWRYLIGADFGPLDSEYDDARLRSALRLF